MQKIVKLKRVLLYCCMVVLFCLQHRVYAAPTQGKPVSLTIKNSSLAEVLRQVSKKSGLYIYFQDADLAGHRNVSLDAKNKPVESVLHELLDERGFSWVEVSENTIAVKKKLEREEVGGKVEMDTVTTITVTGKVVDEKGEPVIGATVVVKGSKIGTTTNGSGNFVLMGVQSNSGLVVSNVSFLTQEIFIKGRSMLGNIRLRPFIGILDEVQIQAYGTTNKRVGTGNISTVKAEDISKAPVANPLLAIQGRVPGVFIEQASGVPGAGVRVRIQGQNSINNGNDPFFVVDGVPYTSQLLPGLNGAEFGTSGGASGGNPLSFINPQDIESIDILKDADATAIYGSRAANGAILITTKKGKAGRTNVNVNFQQGFSKVSRFRKLMNTQQYLEMRKEAFANDGITDYMTNPNIYAPDLKDYDSTKYTNWQKELLGGTAGFTNVQLSVSGGGENTQFMVSSSYQKQTTVTPADLRDQKGGIHFNLNNVSPNQKFKFQFSGNYLYDDNKLSQVNALAGAAFNLPPNAPQLYNSDGSINFEIGADGYPTYWTNPAISLKSTYRNKTSNLVANSVVSYTILNGLEVRSSFGYNKLQTNENTTSPIGFFPIKVQQYSVRESQFNAANIESWIVEPQISYSKKISNNKLDALIGATVQQENRNRLLLKASGFTSDLIMENIKAAAIVTVDGASDATIISQYRYNALFGRINYSIENRYFTSFNLRRDGSSRFGANNKFHNFWSLSGAWIFTGEDWFKNKLTFLSFGKIRASYGTTGSDQIGDYKYLNLYNNISGIETPYQGVVGLEPQDGFPNPYLQWEETKKLSTTMDLGFFDDRIVLSGTYYHNRSSNQLLGLNLPSIVGGGGLPTNLPATVQNVGWEITGTTSNIRSRRFNWMTSINLTIPRNKLVEYNAADSANYRIAGLIGRPLGIQKVYRFSGVDKEIGVYQFIDGNGKITSNPNPDNDRTVFVDLNPSYYGGIQNSISYGDLSIDILFQFVKQKAKNDFFGSNLPGLATNQPEEIVDRWRRPGDESQIQKVTSSYNFDGYQKANQSDKAYTDASYIRLKNVALSWLIPKNCITAINIQSVRVYLQCQNLFTITKFRGLDPETKALSSVIPPLKTIIFGLQVGL